MACYQNLLGIFPNFFDFQLHCVFAAAAANTAWNASAAAAAEINAEIAADRSGELNTCNYKAGIIYATAASETADDDSGKQNKYAVVNIYTTAAVEIAADRSGEEKQNRQPETSRQRPPPRSTSDRPATMKATTWPPASRTLTGTILMQTSANSSTLHLSRAMIQTT